MDPEVDHITHIMIIMFKILGWLISRKIYKLKLMIAEELPVSRCYVRPRDQSGSGLKLYLYDVEPEVVHVIIHCVQDAMKACLKC